MALVLLTYLRLGEKMKHSNMETKIDSEELLERIFSDAHILDVDFSEWDNWIGMIVIPDHFEVMGQENRLPVLLVRFYEVKSISLDLNHYQAMKRVHVNEPGVHFQWHIDDFEVHDENSRTMSYRFWAGSSDPQLKVSCSEITYERLNSIDLDKMFPGWAKPGAAFIRPGITSMLTKQKSNR